MGERQIAAGDGDHVLEIGRRRMRDLDLVTYLVGGQSSFIGECAHDHSRHLIAGAIKSPLAFRPAPFPIRSNSMLIMVGSSNPA